MPLHHADKTQTFQISNSVNNALSLDIEARVGEFGARLSQTGALILQHGPSYDRRITLSPSIEQSATRQSVLVPPETYQAQVSQMNANGYMCGSVHINNNQYDSTRQRPAFWGSDGSVIVLKRIPAATHGTSVDLNSNGDVLLWTWDMSGQVIPMIWSPLQDNILVLRVGIFPRAILNDGAIIGVDRSGGSDTPVITTDRRTWYPLGLHQGYFPDASDHISRLCGSVSIDGFRMPWLMKGRDRPLLLPAYSSHDTNVAYINSQGLIAGLVHSSQDQHVVAWQTK